MRYVFGLLLLTACDSHPSLQMSDASFLEPSSDGATSAVDAEATPTRFPWPTDGSQYGHPTVNGVWIINGFGQYQGGATREGAYIHDGIDFVAPNGTPIYALTRGRVRAIDDAFEYYKWILIEDEDADGLGWLYVHVDDFEFDVGDVVERGAQIAAVRFAGLEHLHLSRVSIPPDTTGSVYDLESRDGSQYFEFGDSVPPIIEEPMFLFSAESGGSPLPADSISGRVDVVVGIRDGGEHAHDPIGGYGDRLSVSRVEVEIADERAPLWSGVAFDAATLTWKLGPTPEEETERTLTLYRFPGDVHPESPEIGDRTFSYYELMRRSQSGEEGEINPSEGMFAWNTEEIIDGRPRFPNGRYTITVRAIDPSGNEATLLQTVEVRNE